MKPTVFIGSSSEQIAVAEAIEVNLADVAEVYPWKHAFRVGQTTYAELLEIKEKFDFAVVVLTPDDLTRSRGTQQLSPRDNVIFELGLFLGVLGAGRVYAIMASNADAKIMSDYAGVAILTYDPTRKIGDLTQALSPACVSIKSEMRRHGARKSTASPGLVSAGLVGLDRIYPTYELAEQDILADLQSSSGPIRLFFHIASQNIGAKGTLLDVIDDMTRKLTTEIRIVHASTDSPLFSRDRLLSLGKNPDRVIRTLKEVDATLRDLEGIAASSLRRRSHDVPFIWRIYGFSERLFLMPYFADKDATKSSPVLLFGKKEHSLYQTFVDWFDYVWEKCAPRIVSLDTFVTPATPCGTALFLKWEGYHVFGIPKRDIIDGSAHVRFYGLGGKRENADEPLETCALREGNEESGFAVDQLETSPATHIFRSDGRLEPITLQSRSPLPRLIFEKKEHTGFGSMKPTDDYYYMIGYNAKLSRKPRPSREIAAILFLRDEHLGMFSRRDDVTVAEILAEGGLLDQQGGAPIRRDMILVPHGTASFLIRMTSR